MRMTPLDIQNQRFRTGWRGLDADEVNTFLAAVAEDYAALLQDLSSSEDHVRKLETRIEELSLNESLLKETLVSAQNLSDELRTAAQQQANLQIGEAEVKAEKILDAAHRRAGRLNQEIAELRGLRSRLAETMRASLETQLAVVDALDSDTPEGNADEANRAGDDERAEPAPSPTAASRAAP